MHAPIIISAKVD